MKLSIVIVSWNTREMLRNCLNSIPSQKEGPAIEIIVVDNDSSDGSADMVAEHFPAVVLIQNSSNLGFAKATNQGLRAASGGFFLLLNSDTIVHGDVIADSLRFMISRPEIGMMGCKVLNEDGSTQMTCSRFPSFLNLLLQTLGLNRLSRPAWLQRYQMLDWERDDERDVDVISGCYLMVRKETLDEIGLLDENFFLYGEETDWCRRCSLSDWRLVFAPVGCITHFGSGSSRQLNYRRDLMLSEGTVRLHRKHGGLLAGFVIWALLLSFNLSRSVYWTIKAALDAKKFSIDRASHFRQITRKFNTAWPSNGGEPV